jgi:hypothetical protein
MDADYQFIHADVVSKWGEPCIYGEKIQHF